MTPPAPFSRREKGNREETTMNDHPSKPPELAKKPNDPGTGPKAFLNRMRRPEDARPEAASDRSEPGGEALGALQTATEVLERLKGQAPDPDQRQPEAGAGHVPDTPSPPSAVMRVELIYYHYLRGRLKFHGVNEDSTIEIFVRPPGMALFSASSSYRVDFTPIAEEAS